MNPSGIYRKLAWIPVGLTVVFLLVPTLIVIPISFTSSSFPDFPPQGFSLRWYQEIIGNPMWRRAVMNSFYVAVATTILSVILGTLAALAFQASVLGQSILRAVTLGPLVTPVIVLAIGLYMIFGQFRMNGTFTALVAGHTVLAIPFVIVTVGASLRLINSNLALAAAGLGAGPLRVFFRIKLPLVLPGLIAGAIFAFITSWDEAVLSLFLTSPQLQTIPVVIWSQVRTELTPAVAAVGTILILISAIGMLAVQVLRRGESK
ncbi:ABC transporter permease [Mesorhizobium sp. M7A.F.Ca.US.011.01.1.1]|uniref:ABC transporter permease n=1 Tax=Mesorhizobium sp. M7A.F.Ca.US.011.01.1.1 TaxID=2496741 RepID=UPI000FCADDC2|nr:ABC transporter permease [Mesorhizobium sp. M7A.F.Ca.US.011.01.1.1]RUX22131.1 ABC transporter permease [Mesorhizobium sp. M7A.F.Ca.US.011.01.1.1]